jgi:NAD(P)H-dependent FMN reductase
MTKVGIILGSTRPGRNGEAVAKWVLDQTIAWGKALETVRKP